MVFEDDPSTTGTGSRYLGEGFRHETEFRDGTATFEVVSESSSAASSTVVPAHRVAKPNLEYVFDDPAHGEPGRDRMVVHGLWELLLAVALGGLGYLLYSASSTAFSGDNLRLLVLGAATIGLLAGGTAVALRAGVPNLAVGPIAVAAAFYYGQHAGSGFLSVLLMVIGLSAALGLVQALIATGLQVPAWAASVAIAVALIAWVGRFGPVMSFANGYNPVPHAYYWFGSFALLSVLAGVLCLMPSIRRASGRFRPVDDPARRRGLIAALIAAGASVASCVLAGIAGILIISVGHRVAQSDGLGLTAIGLAAALLGGTSAFGRRGGILGTVLAASVLAVVSAYDEATRRPWSPLVVVAVAIALGLAVTRLVERFGRPEPGRDEDEDEAWSPRVHAATAATPGARTWPPLTTTTTTTTPATPAAGGLWASDDAWGAR